MPRIEAHEVFDRLWKKSENRNKARRDAYKWMRLAMKLSHSQAHIARFDIEQCQELMRLVYRDHPRLRTFASRLLYGEDYK